jgi:hypothetical protein
MYSTAWTRATSPRGIAASAMRPAITWHPLATRIVPPTATVRSGSRTKGRTARRSEFDSRMQSPSVIATSGWRARLSPAFAASALQPPFSLSTTTRFLCRSDS